MINVLNTKNVIIVKTYNGDKNDKSYEIKIKVIRFYRD